GKIRVSDYNPGRRTRRRFLPIPAFILMGAKHLTNLAVSPPATAWLTLVFRVLVFLTFLLLKDTTQLAFQGGAGDVELACCRVANHSKVGIDDFANCQPATAAPDAGALQQRDREIQFDDLQPFSHGITST